MIYCFATVWLQVDHFMSREEHTPANSNAKDAGQYFIVYNHRSSKQSLAGLGMHVKDMQNSQIKYK